jgi:hypothetical protein
MKKTLLLLALVGIRLGAQQPRPHRPIQDNSFLLEEAYNQERGVVQHISTLVFDNASVWVYALTDEWPLGGQRHQLSVTLPVEGTGNGPALADVAVNYRLQLVGSGDTRLAVTPRLTFILPTASDRLVGGTFAWQAAIASSYVASRMFVLHTNAGLTLTPNAETGTGGKAGLVDLLAGQSVIWLASSRFNVLVEGVATSTERFSGVGTERIRDTDLTISPGVRWAYDVGKSLQIVPGFAFPIGFSGTRGLRSLFLYLSFEHAMPGLEQ